MSDNVPVPTVELLIKELKDVIDDWKPLGGSLGVPVRKLDAIMLNDPNGGVENWKLKMFQFWLQYKPDTSWKDVVRALKENDYNNLAATLSRKYLLAADSSEAQVSTDEIEAEIRATATVVQRLQDLEISFAEMLTDLPDLLTECKCNLSNALRFLGLLFNTKKFSQCDTIEALLWQLRQDHIDAFNTYYLQKLITHFSKKMEEEEKQKLMKPIEDYEAERERFLTDTKVIEFHRTVVCEINPAELSQKTKLTIKISNDLAGEQTLKDIEKLALKAFDERHRSLVRMHAIVGSVVISWFFPEDQSDEFETLVKKNAAVFKDAGVEEVTVGGRVVFPSTLVEDILSASLKVIYTDFYHDLVEAVSDEHTCQSLLTQLSSPALISEEKIAQLTSIKVTGSSFLKTLGLEEEPHLLVPLVSAMSGVEQLKTLAEKMNSSLRSKQGICEEEKVYLKEVYNAFYHQLVGAISDEQVCQSLSTQLRSSAVISEEKISQLISSRASGSSFLNILGVEEQSGLVAVLIKSMSAVEQLQTLASEMNDMLRTKQEPVDKRKQAKLDLERQKHEAELKTANEDLFAQVKHLEDELTAKNEFLILREKTISGMMAQANRRDTVSKQWERSRHLEETLEASAPVDSAEYHSFKVHYIDLLDAIRNPVELSLRLHTAGLLSHDTRLRIDKLVPTKQVHELLDEIETQVRLDPLKFHEFVNELENIGSMQHLCGKLRSTCCKCHMIAFVHMMREKESLNLRTLHLILHGLPAAGKTCAKLRLTGQELTSRKPADLRDGKLKYFSEDGAHSTPVAEEITRARLPASATALTREVDDLPWYLLQSLDEEMVGLVEKIAKQSSETKKVTKPITAVASSSDSVPSSSQVVSALPAEPVGKEFQEMITRAFNKAPHNTLQDILKETHIYLIDSGGQPQFQELLPILVSGPSVFLLTFSLAVPLDAVYEVHFTDKDGNREDYPTNMRVRDVLMQSLASIRCTCNYQTNGKERVEVRPRVIFMATMRSLVSNKEVAAIDKQLKSLVKPFSYLIVYNESGVLFPVDSFTGEGIPALRTAVRCTANDVITKVTGGVPYTSPMCEVKLPTTAVALELLLRNQEKGIISLDQCKRLAIDCNIDPETELPDVLWLLHHSTGSIRYYPEDTTLRQYVVTRPQRLYDIPSTLLTHTFAFKKEGDPFYVPKKKVWTRGVFTMETLRKLWGQDQDLSTELIVTFLIHLNIIVQMQHDEESGEELFFMPSALLCAPNDYFIDAKVSVDSTLICFNGGYPPKGVFSSVIAYLPKEREENEPVDLKWCLPPTVGSLCCNQATLVVSVNDEFDLLVRFTVHLKFIEISVNSECEEDPTSPAQLQLGCEAVLHDVSRAVKVVSQSLYYDTNATLKNGLFFPCYCRDDPSTHAVKYLPKRKKGRCDHDNLVQPDQLWMHKWTKGTSSVVEQSQHSTTAPPPQAERPTTELSPPVVPTSDTAAPILPSADPLNKPPTMRELLRRVASRATDKWELVGLDLEIKQQQLETISQSHPRSAIRCYSEVFSLWQRKADPPFTWATIIDTLRSPIVEENALAQEIEDWLLGTTAR